MSPNPKDAKHAAAAAPTNSILSGLSEEDIARLVARGRAAEEQEAAKSMGKQEKARIARAQKAILLREAKDARKKAGKPTNPTISEAKEWITAHPPTPKKTK